MAKGLNKVMLIGHLGNDPEMKVTTSGQSRVIFTLATTESYKDNDGNWQEKPEWHRIVVWGKLAEICSQYLKKGRPVYVEGRIKTRKYTDKDGVEKYATDIIANEMQMLGAREGMGEPSGDDGNYDSAPRRAAAPARAAAAPAPRQAPPPRPASGFDDMDDDIPF